MPNATQSRAENSSIPALPVRTACSIVGNLTTAAEAAAMATALSPKKRLNCDGVSP